MGIVPRTFKQATCTRLLLWFALLLLVDMLVLADMLPTLPELSMLPRDPLMLSQRLRLLSSTELTDMVDMVLDMLDTDMELTHMPLDMPMVVTHMPMVPTTERDLLMPSQKLRLMLLSSTELMDMVDTVLDLPDTDMELTHMPLDPPMVVTHMPMVPTT